MGISEDIKQSHFKSEFNKAIVNIIYTNSWLNQSQVGFFKQFDVTTPQYNLLRILRGQYPNPATVNLLIERMLDKSSNASRIVDKLEAKGLVQRKQCSKDRRAVDVVITQQGLDLLAEIDGEMERWENSFKNLSEEECATLNSLLDKMRVAPLSEELQG
ncbi:MarR family winged helix-turn-helix transcriptional regulator [Marinoscillum pacificum]|uniref:MarR family winged helix-turn-helix transcriptional regulator n=1 Tax=Marinoscillum pacificum TaxID=392723 RepID=UPI0021571468|nr:MarR family transcriptional regulator [Marinoscillum pacificum]